MLKDEIWKKSLKKKASPSESCKLGLNF
jgi:hypothetical protein